MPDQLEKLTLGEQLLIHRRRRGETQGEAARRNKVAHSRYSLCERDLDDSLHLGFKISCSTLAPHERCLLYRRRVGWTQKKVAADLGCCRRWLNMMERGEVDPTPLLDYWEC